MKFDIKAKVFSITFSKMLTQYCKTHEMGYDVNDYLPAIKKEYRDIIERTPALQKGNNMQENLTGASYFFAMAKVLPNMTPDLMNDMVDYCMYSDLMVKMHKGEREKGKMFSDKAQDKMIEGAIASQNSNYEMDWKYTYEKHPNEYFLTFTKCGVCRLAERENLLEYLPCMCRMDYPKYDVKGCKLERTKTLAKGDECCDFHVMRKAPEDLNNFNYKKD